MVTALKTKDDTVLLPLRLAAKAIDLFLIFILSLILPHPVGVFMGLIYILLHDGLPGGQSLGKRLFGFKVSMYNESGHAKVCDYKSSAIRNAPIGVATFFAIIPFWGWFIAILLGLPMLFIETYLMSTRPKGARLGDAMADTVVEVAAEQTKLLK